MELILKQTRKIHLIRDQNIDSENRKKFQQKSLKKQIFSQIFSQIIS